MIASNAIPPEFQDHPLAQRSGDFLPMLCPPGSGVFAVSTGLGLRASLQHQLYQTNDPALVQQQFIQGLAEALRQAPQQPLLLGIPSDCGGGIQRGANWGPLYLRQHLYAQSGFASSVIELGDLRVIPHLLHDKYLNQATLARCRDALYGSEAVALPVSPLSQAEAVLMQVYAAYPDSRVLGLGGDHSVSYPLIATVLQHHRQCGRRCGLLHFDAHTDLSSHRLGLDLTFGSWLAQLLPWFEQPSDVVQVGIRASAKDKSYWQRECGVRQFWAEEVHTLGDQAIAHAIEQALSAVDCLYITVDIDALDAKYASATGTPESDGLMMEQILTIIQHLGKVLPIAGADLVEVAPQVNANANPDEPTTTLRSASLIANSLIALLKQRPG